VKCVDEVEAWPTGRLLSTAARMVEHAWNGHLARWHLNHAGLAVLHLLARQAMTQRELAGRVQVQEQTLSRTVERLERSGYLERHRDAADRRRNLVRLTATGRAVLLEAGPEAAAEALFDPAGDDVAALRRALIALVRHQAGQRWPEPVPGAPDPPDTPTGPGPAVARPRPS
jgi:MarR family transcriptional regulator, organic hydroperoxide resistance regulator